MKKYLFLYAALLFTFSACESNGPENRLPEETVPLSEYVGEAVDLGLSVNWASTNVSNYYYYWACTVPLGDYDSFDWDDPYDTDYTCHTGSKYDVARMSWGGDWRTPTEAEWKELKTKCTLRWDGRGMVVTGPNGNSIYLPANAPYGRFHVYYWTSSRRKNGDYKGSPEAVYVSDFGLSGPEPASEHNGCRVRPVCSK